MSADNKGKLESINCPVCGATEFKVKLKKSPSGRIVKCLNCRVFYANPRNTADLIKSQTDGEKFDKLFFDQVSEFPWRKKTFLNRLAMIKKHFPKSGKLLDIGCYSGLFLWLCELRGFETFGVEPTRAGAEFARDIFKQNVTRGILTDAKYPPNYFDVITLMHTIEHLPNPRETINQAVKLLKPGGMLFIETPNASSIWFKILRGKWRQCIADHFVLFSKKTLPNFLKNEGLEIIGQKSVGRVIRLSLLDKRIKQYYSGLFGAFLAKLLRFFKCENKTVTVNLGDVLWIEARKK